MLYRVKNLLQQIALLFTIAVILLLKGLSNYPVNLSMI